MPGNFLSVVTFVFVGVFEGDEPTLVSGWKFFSLSRHPAGIIDEGGNGVRAEDDSNSTERINVVQRSEETP